MDPFLQSMTFATNVMIAAKQKEGSSRQKSTTTFQAQEYTSNNNDDHTNNNQNNNDSVAELFSRDDENSNNNDDNTSQMSSKHVNKNDDDDINNINDRDDITIRHQDKKQRIIVDDDNDIELKLLLQGYDFSILNRFCDCDDDDCNTPSHNRRVGGGLQQQQENEISSSTYSDNIIPVTIQNAINEHNEQKIRTGPFKRRQVRNLICRLNIPIKLEHGQHHGQRQEQISLWEWILPMNAEPNLFEYYNKDVIRIIWIQHVSNHLYWIGNGVIGTRQEESTRELLNDWLQDDVIVLQPSHNDNNNQSKMIGWVHSNNMNDSSNNQFQDLMNFDDTYDDTTIALSTTITTNQNQTETQLDKNEIKNDNHIGLSSTTIDIMTKEEETTSNSIISNQPAVLYILKIPKSIIIHQQQHIVNDKTIPKWYQSLQMILQKYMYTKPNDIITASNNKNDDYDDDTNNNDKNNKDPFMMKDFLQMMKLSKDDADIIKIMMKNNLGRQT